MLKRCLACTLRRALALLLALCLLAVLAAGCAEKEEPVQPGLTYAELLATVKQTVEGGLAACLDSATQFVLQDGKLWAYGLWYNGDVTSERFTRLASMDLQTETCSWVEVTRPLPDWEVGEEQSIESSVYGFCADENGGILLLVNHELMDYAPGEWDPIKAAHPLQRQFSLCVVDEGGTLRSTAVLQLPEELVPQEGENLSPFANSSHSAIWTGADGVIHTVWTKAIDNGMGGANYAGGYLISFLPDGSCKNHLLLSEVSADGPWYLSDGSLLFVSTPDLAREQPIPAQLIRVSGLEEGKAVTETLQIPDEFGRSTPRRVIQSPPPQNGEERLPCFYNDSGVWQLDTDLQTLTQLISWEDYHIEPFSMDAVIELGAERFLVVLSGRSQSYVKLQPMQEDLLAGREVVTLGVNSAALTEELDKAVQAYNFGDPSVYIQTVDYSDDAAAAAGFDSGTAMLTDAVLHGTAPDILLLPSDIGSQHFVRQGLFIDLYPYMDADAELQRSDFVPGVLAACENNGTLPTVIPAYSLLTAAASPALAGAEPGWTWQQYTDCAATLPELEWPFYPYDRQTLLHWQVQLGGSDFIDYGAGQCHFDTPAFEALLTASAAQSEEMADTTADPKPFFQEGQALTNIWTGYSFQGLKTLRYIFDGDFVFKGFPTDSENVTGSAFSAVLRLGITRYCKNPDAAWGFLRTLLLPVFQDDLGFALPLRQDSLQAMALAAQRPDENALPPIYFDPAALTENQLAYWQQGAQAADCEALLAAVQNTHILYQYDGVIYTILLEEADYFYNGVRSAAEAAAIIQNRVQTYLDEQA